MLLYLKDEHTRHSEVICNFDLLPPNTHTHMHAHATTFAGRDMSYIRRAITMEILELDQRRSASNCRAVVPHELLISGSGASSPCAAPCAARRLTITMPIVGPHLRISIWPP